MTAGRHRHRSELDLAGQAVSAIAFLALLVLFASESFRYARMGFVPAQHPRVVAYIFGAVSAVYAVALVATLARWLVLLALVNVPAFFFCFSTPELVQPGLAAGLWGLYLVQVVWLVASARRREQDRNPQPFANPTDVAAPEHPAE